MKYYLYLSSFFKEIFLPFGIQSTQIHVNMWDDKYYNKFETFIETYMKKVIDLNYIIKLKILIIFKI